MRYNRKVARLRKPKSIVKISTSHILNPMSCLVLVYGNSIVKAEKR